MANKRTPGQSSTGGRSTSPATSRSDTSNSSKASSPVESQKSQIDFQFLNFSHPSEAKASRARKAVRSHVTRQQHQREHAAAAARKAKTFPQIDDDAEEGPSQPAAPRHTASFPPERPSSLGLPTSSTAGGSSAGTSSPSPSPSSTESPPHRAQARINPAELYPEEWHPYLQRIIEHYLSNVAVDIPEIDGSEANGLLRTRFFPFVMTDPAPFHAVMLIAASHYEKVRGSQSHGIDLLQLRGMAIREINGALEDQARGTSDQLIAAVAQMASYEALFGDEDIYNTHMTGLLRMVSLRGGLPALGLDGLLERMVLWIDINAAHIMGSHIYFDRTAFPSSVRHPKPDPRRFTGGITRQASD